MTPRPSPAAEAVDPRTSPERLAKLAHVESLHLPLASNPSTPHEILGLLAWNPALGAVLASNPALPEDLQRRLKSDTNERWAAARSLADLGQLTAAWLEGTLLAHPAWCATKPDAETSPLVDVLAGLNRAGWVTEQSQPGEALVDGAGQRAFVALWCDGHGANTIADAVLGTRLITFRYPPGTGSSAQRVPVSMWLFEQPCTWMGGRSDDLAEALRPRVHPDAVDALEAAVLVEAFDPEWDESPLLWDTLSRAVTAESRATR